MPAISIIVPIFNVEKYLYNCLDSILAQTYSDFELILVNDGSVDTCGEICDLFAEKDNRIKVIHKENGGVSSARNKGIEIAKGDYLAFVDPDDTIENNMYNLLIESALDHDADIVVCPIKTVNIGNNNTSISPIWKDVNCIINKKTIANYIIPSILNNNNYSLASSVNKLYKKSLFKFYNISFEEHKHHSEDARLNFTLLTLINRLVFIEQPLYNYFIRERDSLTQVFRENLYEYALDNKKLLIDICKKYNLEKYINTVRNHYTSVTLLHMQDVVKRNISINNKFKVISSIMNDKDFIKDILRYNCKSYYEMLLKCVCILKNEKIFYYSVRFKIRIKGNR
ncbi:glycosyltransferase [Metabacillus idriensis]|uniref:glycosyltransferase n=1 Tax=Metabacillus idriensis TaxID=324768 RepID=UPI00174C7F88|nr:glycosyltransferase [Metabacillus idriensis]